MMALPVALALGVASSESMEEHLRNAEQQERVAVGSLEAKSALWGAFSDARSDPHIVYDFRREVWARTFYYRESRPAVMGQQVVVVRG